MDLRFRVPFEIPNAQRHTRTDAGAGVFRYFSKKGAMTAATVPGIDATPTENDRLLTWVRDVADLAMPNRVVWCDCSDDEWDRVTSQLVAAGTRTFPARIPDPTRYCRCAGPSGHPR